MDNIIELGKIVKAQGIKGEVKIALLSDEKDAYKQLKHVTVDNISYTVTSVKYLVNGVFIKLVGVDDRNSAELLRGKIVRCEKANMPKLPVDRYYIEDLIGLNISVGDVTVGTLVNIMQNGSADVYCVKGLPDHKGFMFPALAKVLLKVDIVGKIIILDAEILAQIAVYED